ncbi:M56 family metallopeptidase [Paenibacillus elgii]|uniref:M56 family metallopeptidase n=1 Tax=Paenibacillus elgii TaxID=189691 RepID=UPI0005859770|nr:M56 family metallopeptidase [Paenibacillus elgii]
MEILCETFIGLWYSTLAASAVALLVMAIQALFRHRISARIRHALWLIVLVRLLLPVFPDSPVSLFHMLHFGKDIKKAVSLIIPLTEKENNPSAERSRNSQEKEYVQNDHSMIRPEEDTVPDAQLPAGIEDSAHFSHPWGLKIIAAVWLAGTLALLTYLFVYMLKMRRRFKTLTLVTDPRILSVVDDCRRKFGIKRPIPVYTGSYARSPYISGLIRPWIYFPEGIDKELSIQQLTHVFSHELAHHKRKDVAWNLLGSFLLAVHWINPVVWMSIKRMKADRELACDACVMEVLGEAEAVPYGMTIIGFLKHFSVRRHQPNLLYFDGSTNTNQLVRRIEMIKSFKAGSYKLSAVAVLGVALLSAATLTNAAAPAAGDGVEQAPVTAIAKTEDRILFDSSSRSYDNLEKAAKVADFKFKAPSALPEGYKFEEISLESKSKNKARRTKANVHYTKRQGNTMYGQFRLLLESGRADLDEAYTEFEEWEKKTAVREIGIKKEPLTLHGMPAYKVIVSTKFTKKTRESLYYFWLDGSVLYRLDGGDLSEQELLAMIASMKYPDQEMYQSYVSQEVLNASIYDTGDLRRAPEAIGLKPKFPLEVLEQYTATGATITQKINFGYPDGEEDRKTRLLSIRYIKTDDKDKDVVQSFSFMQIKNGTMYEDMKKNGNAAFYRIDGKKHTAPVSPMVLGGREVLRTAKYKIDGELSSPDEIDFISYYWKEGDVCFQVVFKGEGLPQEEIVAYLVNEKVADLNNLK